MYAGSTLTKFSGRLVGAHQKFDSVARRHLSHIIPDNEVFPKIRKILAFEGRNGPDGIKRKSPARDEPWHFFDPFDDKDTQLIQNIQEHYTELIVQLKSQNQERVAFESAWLAHAIVDGLTPAHHYPYEEELKELRGGEGNDTRDSVMKKLVIAGSTRKEVVKNNWKMWGPKGLMSTHAFFELGVASIIKPLNFAEAIPRQRDMKRVLEIGIAELFKQSAREIAVLDMYHAYYQKGWTPKLAWQVRHKLGPIIVQTVTLAWYAALVDAGIVKD